MILERDNGFILHTKNTTYAFKVTETGHLEHLYYGRKITVDPGYGLFDVMTEKHAFAPGNTIHYNKEHPEFSPEDMCLEMSSHGKGDIREPFVEIVHVDGSCTSDFTFSHAKISKGTPNLTTLPCSYSDETDEIPSNLTIVLRDEVYDLTLELHYFVYEESDVITRYSRLINTGKYPVQLKRLMSTQLDFDTCGLRFTTFTGAWVREMHRTDSLVKAGKTVNASYTGTSSNRSNPFVIIGNENTSEDFGACIGVNLVYSGNHYEAMEVSAFGKTRFVSGINPQGFCYVLDEGEAFESPEAVMTFSHAGLNSMSQNMHRFVRAHIVRGKWKHKARPVLVNSWEAAYFNINEKKLLKLAKAAKKVGAELFVMDDGWFGKRNDDTSSLGDWQVNLEKLPNGLDGLAKKIKAIGLDFGIWVEPEMISVDSELYRNHPEWSMEIPGMPHSEGRNQRLLNLTRTDVQDFVIDSMSAVFSSADISYVKWDMNRIMSDVYSAPLSAEKQGETAHRYVLGLYRIMRELTGRFPGILFEGCASGGNRFDLGILCYFPQIWASDNTDAVCRVNAMTNYSYGYPMSTVTAHVSSCPNHQTLRNTPLDTRFNVAAFGVLGYECNLCDMSGEQLKEISHQISLYKQFREVLQFGDFYRGRSGNMHEWTVVSPDKHIAVGMLMQELVAPNTQFHKYYAKGLLPEGVYRFSGGGRPVDIKNFGELINTALPIHIKHGSVLQNILSKLYKMPGETEDYCATGDTLMYAGVKLKQAFSGTGYSSDVRYFQDFSSRMYFMDLDHRNFTKDLMTGLFSKLKKSKEK